MSSYLSIEALTVSYGGPVVLDRVSLDVERGEMVALLGSSGCGKTTLLRSIAGFVIPDSGTIRIEGRDIAQLPPEARGTAMMFQSYALWPHMSVADNIGYGLRMRGWKKDAIAGRVDEMLKLLQLEGFGPRPVTQLSGGQRQRVALGRALAVSPHVLLLDEPMSNLDYKVRLELRHELRALQQRIGITAVYVTHDREEALTLSDRIAVIDAGRIVQTGAPEEIFHHPSSAFVAGFMGADNALDVVLTGDGGLAAGTAEASGPALRAHFRSDAARLAPAAAAAAGGADLVLQGVVTQSVYVGQGYRYRVRADGAEIWVHAPDRVAEGTAACVVVPRAALLLFPRDKEPVRSAPA
jgi:ABC-type Fe3+/spermidine/putrescine transport system ATPase subunit